MAESGSSHDSRGKRGSHVRVCVGACACVALASRLIVLLERSSQDTNHTLGLSCLLSTYPTIRLHLFLFCSLCLTATLCFSPSPLHNQRPLVGSWTQSGSRRRTATATPLFSGSVNDLAVSQDMKRCSLDRLMFRLYSWLGPRVT